MTSSFNTTAIREQYHNAGFAGRVGWGARPALLVIDMARAWVDPGERLGSDLSCVLTSIQRLLVIARDARLPIYFTTIAYGSPAEGGSVVSLKLAHLDTMLHASERGARAPELACRSHEPPIERRRGSAVL